MGKENQTSQPEFERKIGLLKEMALKQGGFTPTLIVEGSQEPVITEITEMPSTHAERAQRMFSLGMALAQDGRVGDLKSVWFVSEGWMTMAKDAVEPPLPPSKDPNAVEVLSIMTLAINGEKISAKGVLFEMLRDPDGKLNDLQTIEEFNEQQGKTIESPLLMAFVKGFLLGGLPITSYLN